ncbi:MAG: hypothetical protein CR988_01445 [Treponema sp.]|nr:MAG: hypothetical protein CR988_01445 [Treponema sp.]
MPALYAHWTLGNKSIPCFSAKTQKVITKYRYAFDIGLQGPDFLFFKDMGANKATKKLAMKLHYSPFKKTLEKFMAVYLNDKQDIVLSYLYGFIGHFVLDTNGHEYINMVVDRDGVNHNELETEFDRHLANAGGINMFKLKTERFLTCDEQTANAISQVFSVFNEVSSEDIKKSIHDYYTLKKLIRIMQRFVPFVLDPAFKILNVEEFAGGINLKRKINAKLLPYVAEVQKRYDTAFEMYPKLIKNFNEALNGADLSDYFNRDFEQYKKGE